MRDSDWSRQILLRSDWLVLNGAIMTTSTDQEPSLLLNVTEDYFLGVHIRLYQLDTRFVSLQNQLAFPSKVT